MPCSELQMASVGTSHSLKFHNHFDTGRSFWSALNVGFSSNWHPLRLNFNSRSPPGAKRAPSHHSPKRKSLSGISETHDNWAVVRASATPPLIPLAALALLLQRVKERLHLGGERGYPLVKTTVKKWLTGLQGGGGNNILRVPELGNGRFLQHGGIGMALLSTTSMAREHISPVLGTLGANPTFMSGLLAWLIAQILKVFTTFIVERRWDLKMLVGSGGMPSSHSALCIGLTTSVALCHGVSDCLFPVCLGFSLIVMYDATGVRRHAGMQAEVLNMIVEDLFKGHPISERKLKEILGHTPLQVFAGACLGVLVGYLCSQSSSVTA